MSEGRIMLTFPFFPPASFISDANFSFADFKSVSEKSFTSFEYLTEPSLTTRILRHPSLKSIFSEFIIYPYGTDIDKLFAYIVVILSLTAIYEGGPAVMSGLPEL